jgi:hypothetical protein
MKLMNSVSSSRNNIKASAFKVNEEIPLWASTQQGITERLVVVLPALE